MRPSSTSLKRATAALIPSSEVPDIKPTTTPVDTLALLDRRRCVFRDTTDYPAIFGEKLFRRFARYSFLLHYDRELDALAGALEKFGGFVARNPAHFHYDPLTPIDELVVGSAEIDHQIAVRFAEPDHRAGRDRIEYKLGSGSGLHARRSGHDFRTDDRQNHDVDPGDKVSGRRGAGDDSGAGAQRAGSLESRAHVRGRS